MPTPSAALDYHYFIDACEKTEIERGVWYYLGQSNEDCDRYFENISRLFIDRQLSYLELRDDCEYA